jgi:hypothetical protein
MIITRRLTTMRILTALALILLTVSLTASSRKSNDADATKPAQESAAAGWSGGAALTVAQVTPLADLVADPGRFVGQTVRLEGQVTGVCKGVGCWVQVADAAGHDFIAKSTDHSIAFPKDCEGRQVVLQGEIIVQPGTAPEAHAHAEGEGAHECPAPQYMMSLAAATLR